MINVRAINLDNVGALVIGSNREARKTDLEETVDVLENLQDHMDCERIGKTNFAAFFPKGREVDVQVGKFLVGSMIVLKVTEYGLEPLDCMTWGNFTLFLSGVAPLFVLYANTLSVTFCDA